LCEKYSDKIVALTCYSKTQPDVTEHRT